MSAATIERTDLLEVSRLEVPLPDVHGTRTTAPGRSTPGRVRPGRGSGRAVSPQARPPGVEVLGDRRLSRTGAARSCTAAPTANLAGSVRLTDRGIAVVLVVITMIAVAALSVVGLTAFRVTGERFAPTTAIVAQT